MIAYCKPFSNGCQLISTFCDYNYFAQHNLQYAKSKPKSQRATNLWWQISERKKNSNKILVEEGIT